MFCSLKIHGSLSTLFLFLLFNKNFSLRWKRQHCRWRAEQLRPILGAQSLWAGMDLYSGTLAVTWSLGFFRSHSYDLPIHSLRKGLFIIIYQWAWQPTCEFSVQWWQSLWSLWVFRAVLCVWGHVLCKGQCQCVKLVNNLSISLVSATFAVVP